MGTTTRITTTTTISTTTASRKTTKVTAFPTRRQSSFTGLRGTTDARNENNSRNRDVSHPPVRKNQGGTGRRRPSFRKRPKTEDTDKVEETPRPSRIRPVFNGGRVTSTEVSLAGGDSSELNVRPVFRGTKAPVQEAITAKSKPGPTPTQNQQKDL